MGQGNSDLVSVSSCTLPFLVRFILRPSFSCPTLSNGQTDGMNAECTERVTHLKKPGESGPLFPRGNAAFLASQCLLEV